MAVNGVGARHVTKETEDERHLATDHVTGALRKLRGDALGRNPKTVHFETKDEDHGTRRSSSPGGSLRRKYDWNTTHFYPDIPDIHHLGDAEALQFTSALPLMELLQDLGTRKETGNAEEREEEEEDEEEEEEDGEEKKEEDVDKYDSSEEASERSSSSSSSEEKESEGRERPNVVVPADIIRRVRWMDMRETSPGENVVDKDYSPMPGRLPPGPETMRKLQQKYFYLKRPKRNYCPKESSYVHDVQDVCSADTPENFAPVPIRVEDETDDEDDVRCGRTRMVGILYQESSSDADAGQRPSPVQDKRKAREPLRRRDDAQTHCTVTHFDDLWPVTEIGINPTERRKPIPSMEKLSTRSPGNLRSILRSSKGKENVDCVRQKRRTTFASQKSAAETEKGIYNLPLSKVTAAESTDSCSSVENLSRASRRGNEADTRTEEKRTSERVRNLESCLFAKDPEVTSEPVKHGRFVIDYRKPAKGLDAPQDDARAVADSFTLKEFELCLEVPQNHQHGGERKTGSDEVSQIGRIEFPPAQKMSGSQESCQSSPETCQSSPETCQSSLETCQSSTNLGKRYGDGGALDEDTDMVWLFNRLYLNRMLEAKSGDSEYYSEEDKRRRTQFSAEDRLRRPRSAILPFQPTIFENTDSTSEEPQSQDRTRKEEDAMKASTRWMLRQQYRWSTSIREPEARMLLDNWENKPMQVADQNKTLPIPRLPTKYRTRYFPGYGKHWSDEASTSERAFTITGQPKSRNPVQIIDDLSPARYALVGISHPTSDVSDEFGPYTNSPNATIRTVLENLGGGTRFDRENSQKYKYLRERIIFNTSDKEIVKYDPTPISQVQPRPVFGFNSLQNLEDLRWSVESSNRQNWYGYSNGSVQSLPQKLISQPEVETYLSSPGSHDSLDQSFKPRRLTPEFQGVRNFSGSDLPMAEAYVMQSREFSDNLGLFPPDFKWKYVPAEAVHHTKSNRKPEVGKQEVTKPLLHEDRLPKLFRKSQKTPRIVKAKHEWKTRQKGERNYI